MRNFLTRLKQQRWPLVLSLLGIVVVGGLLSWRLSSLLPALSLREQQAAHAIYGWHGIYRNPLNAPLDVLRSAVLLVNASPGSFLLRVPNVLFGMVAIAAFGAVVYDWFGARIAAFATLLFICSAWVLHVSRLGTNDVLYLMIIPLLLLLHIWLNDAEDHPKVLYAAAAIWVSLLYIPGGVWYVLASLVLQWRNLADGWIEMKGLLGRGLLVLEGILGVALLGNYLARSVDHVTAWIGLPDQLPTAMTYLKYSGGAVLHLVYRGPTYPDVWLGNSPVFDIFCLSMAVVGLYVYATHLKSQRTRTLGIFAVIGLLLAGALGSAGFTLLIPVVLLLTATGIAYLLRQWLHTFPINPLARWVGIGLVSVVVLLSCAYNLRSYFVAWPHAQATRQTFRYKP